MFEIERDGRKLELAEPGVRAFRVSGSSLTVCRICHLFFARSNKKSSCKLPPSPSQVASMKSRLADSKETGPSA